MKNRNLIISTLIIISATTLFFSYETADNPILETKVIRIEYDSLMKSIIHSKFEDTEELMDKFYPSEQLILNGDTLAGFYLSDFNKINIKGENKLILEGFQKQDSYKIKKIVEVRILEEFPSFVLTTVKYINQGDKKISITGWINNHYELKALENVEPPFWSFQGASYPDRRDWVQPVTEGFSQRNYMGMNASDYGGGTPASDVWRPDAGIAVGQIEKEPKLVAIPVEYNSQDKSAEIEVAYEYESPKILEIGDTLTTYETFVSVHTGDYFNTLENFSKILQKKGVSISEFPETSYESIWCAWGYERNFTTEEVIKTLPKVADMGYKWAVLDDGWQTAEGDWFLNPKRFPNGDEDMKKFVDQIHEQNLQAKLWWAPLAVDPGTELIEQNSDMLLLNKDGSKQDITWWDSYYLCPAYDKTIEYHKDLVKEILGDWDYDGLKIDGQHLNGVPPCYNSAHNHEYPEESVEKLPAFFEAIYETALEIKPDAVIEICPCGTAYSFYNLPFMNQTVSSDPLSSWQIRLKGKTLKALHGRSSPYYGDHVELSSGGEDFASTIGVGGIVGTKFTWPTDRLDHDDYVLTEEKEEKWRKWLNIYDGTMLSKGEYLGDLYDIGYYKPETHAVRKYDTLYYAFYSDDWKGEVELRGLKKQEYQIINYENNTKVDTVTGERAKLSVEFVDHLLLKAIPLEL